MPYSGNWKRVMGIGREASYGVAGTISEWVNFEDAKFDLEIPNENVPQVVGQRILYKTYQKARQLSPSVSFDVEAENGMGVVLRSLFGTSASASINGTFTTAYRHTFTLRNDVEVDSLWVSLGQLGTNTKNYTGLFPTKLTLSFNENENLKAKVDLLGQNELTGTFNNGTFSTSTPLNSYGQTLIQIDGVNTTDVQNFEINIDASGKDVITLGTLSTKRKIVQGMFNVEGKFDIYFNDEVERAKFIAKTASRLDLTTTGATISGTAKQALNLKIPAVEYVAVPFEDKDGITGASVAWKAIYGANATGTGVLIAELQNSKASY